MYIGHSVVDNAIEILLSNAINCALLELWLFQIKILMALSGSGLIRFGKGRG